MLELKDISFQVNDETADKEILKNINLKIEDRWQLPDQTVEVNPRWRS